MKYFIVILVLMVAGWFYFGSVDTSKKVYDDPEVSVVDEHPVSKRSEGEVENVIEQTENASGTESVVEATEFTLDAFNFGYSENEIKVKVGDAVTINLTNSDGFHDFVIDEFGVATKKIKTGETDTVTFVADKAGTFEYYCSVGSHRANGMVGSLIVE